MVITFNLLPLGKWKISVHVLPRSVIWSSCHSCRWFSPWNQCPPCWQRPAWRSRRRSGTGRRFCQRCCYQWWGSWTYSQSFGPKSPSARMSLLLTPSASREEEKKRKVKTLCRLRRSEMATKHISKAESKIKVSVYCEMWDLSCLLCRPKSRLTLKSRLCQTAAGFSTVQL